MSDDSENETARPLTWEERTELERRQYEAERQASAKRYAEFRAKLFGTDDRVAILAPQSISDYGALLGEHAAQLRNAVRQAMEIALSEHTDTAKRIPMLGVLARLVQTNLAIAKAMTDDPA